MSMSGENESPASMRRRKFDMGVPANPRMVSRVRQALEELELPPALLSEAQLLASELVTNSIRHSGLRPDDLVRIRASWSGTKLRVDVYDRSGLAAPPPVAGTIRPTPGADSGWGLYLVERLASRWGAAPGRYWFELEFQYPERDGG